MKYFFLLLTVFIFACNQRKNYNSNNSNGLNDSTEKTNAIEGKYNPKVDSVYFIPANGNAIISDTLLLGYSIKTSISQMKDSNIILFRDYFKANRKRIDKMIFRNYNLEINIENSIENISIKRIVNKYDFTSITRLVDPKYNFLRKVKFMGIENNEFRFDITLTPNAFVKYFISRDNKIRFEDFPQTFYDSLYPEPIFE